MFYCYIILATSRLWKWKRGDSENILIIFMHWLKFPTLIMKIIDFGFINFVVVIVLFVYRFPLMSLDSEPLFILILRASEDISLQLFLLFIIFLRKEVDGRWFWILVIRLFICVSIDLFIFFNWHIARNLERFVLGRCETGCRVFNWFSTWLDICFIDPGGEGGQRGV